MCIRDSRLDGFAGALRSDILQHQAVLLEDAGVLAKRRGLVLPVIDLPDRELELIVGASRGTRERQRHDQPERGGDTFEFLHAMSSLTYFLSLQVFYRCKSCVAAFNTECRPGESLNSQRRRILRIRRGFAAARADLAFLTAVGTPPAKPPDLATRIDQYSQERVSPVVLAVIWPASCASPGDSEAMVPPIVRARTWYSALRAE